MSDTIPDEWVRGHRSEEDELDSLRSATRLQKQRNNLLARIHRDGGQYLAAHGANKALEDADLIVANLYAESARRLAILRELVACKRLAALINDTQDIEDSKRPGMAQGVTSRKVGAMVGELHHRERIVWEAIETEARAEVQAADGEVK